MSLKHFRNHRREYAGFFVVAFLIACVGWKYFKVSASSEPVFQDYVGRQTVSLPDHFAPLSYASGIAFDSHGNMYVADNVSIDKFDPSGNFLFSFGGLGESEGHFYWIDGGIAVDSQDNIYVVNDDDSDTYEIEKFDANGNFLLSFPLQGGYPEHITIKSDQIYLATCGGDGRVEKYDLQGTLLLEAIGPNVVDGTQSCATGVDVDSSGNIYVANYTNSIQKFDSAGNFISQFGVWGTEAGNFKHPYDIKFDNSGTYYYVVEQDGRRIQKFDTNGSSTAIFGSFGTGPGQFTHPYGIAFDASNNIFVADSILQKFDSSGTYVSKWYTGVPPGLFVSPFDVTHDSQGSLYITDRSKNTVQKFDTEGHFLWEAGSSGSGDGQFAGPQGITTDDQDNVYVADTGNDRIQKFNASGDFLMKFGSSGSGLGQFSGPTDVAVDSSGNMYVTEYYNKRVQKFDASGAYLSTLNDPDIGDSSTQNAQAITIDAQGNLYVTYYGNNRIQKFDADGTFVSRFGSSGVADNDHFSGPTSPVVDEGGNIYIADAYNSRIQKYDNNFNYLSTFTGLGIGGFGIVQALTILSDGRFVVVDNDNRRVLFFSQSPLTISAVSATTTSSTATISFTTDDLGTTQVEFGPSTSYGSSTLITDISPKVTSHAATISSLAPCSSYAYRVLSANDTSTTTSSNFMFTTRGCTAMASTTATTATTASTTSTSTVTLSTIEVSVPPTFSTTTVATTTFQALKLDPVAFFASTTVPEGTKAATADVFHLTALTSATTTLTTFTAPITVTLRYDRQQLVGINEATLKIYRYDQGSWNVLSNCTRDPSAQSVTCETSHFSDFTILGDPDSSSVTHGASGYQVPPTGELSITPPAATGGGYAPAPPVVSTSPAVTPPSPAKPVITPVKIVPKAVVVPKTTAKPVAQPKATTTTPRLPVNLPPQALAPIERATGTIAVTPIFKAAQPIPGKAPQPPVHKATLWEKIKNFFSF
jgi:tripartite motif-containing protein 71